MDNLIKATSKTQDLTYELKIQEVMDVNYQIVNSSMTVSSLREVLRKKRILGVPVVDNDELVGIVSIEDFIKCMEQGKLGETVETMMTKDVKTLFADEPLIHAVMKFEEYGFSRFPVISRDTNKLVGIVTKIDIIKGILKKLETVDQHEEERRYRASHIFQDIIADEISIQLKYYVEGRNFDKAGEASTGLKKTLNRLGFPPEIVRRVTISTYEAEINIVSYTEKGEITAYIDSNQVKMLITDKGPGIADINKAMEPGYSTAPGWVRELGFGAGMGLPNIKKFTDKMTLKSTVGKGTRLETVINLNNYRNENK
ncbi:MAG: CBS domain-containing protein [Candidatus Delongbacteria bacterium]|nr:CBS domain-containing protein [Candidatus Delongbacteria bacterium]